jgi:hypothetical protein
VTKRLPQRHWRSYGNDPLPTPADALAERGVPSWFLRIECDRCGRVQMVNEAHAKWRDRTLRDILARMRHDGCGGLAAKAQGRIAHRHRGREQLASATDCADRRVTDLGESNRLAARRCPAVNLLATAASLSERPHNDDYSESGGLIVPPSRATRQSSTIPNQMAINSTQKVQAKNEAIHRINDNPMVAVTIRCARLGMFIVRASWGGVSN